MKQLLLDNHFVQSRGGYFYKDYSLMNLICKRKWNKIHRGPKFSSYKRVKHKDIAKVKSVLLAYIVYKKAGPMSVLSLCNQLYLAYTKKIDFDEIEIKSKKAQRIIGYYRSKSLKELFIISQKLFAPK